MPSKAVSDAVSSHLSGGFSDLRILDMNADFAPPPDGAGFVQLQFPLALEEQRSVGAPGSNIFREEGALRLVVAVPVGRGTDALLTVVDDLRSLFRNRIISGVRTYEAAPAVLDDGNEFAGYFVGSTAIAYEYDLLT